MRVFLAAAALFGCLITCPAGASSAVVVGTATEIVRDVTGRLGESMVVLSLGDAVYRNQRIATARDSSALLTLADESRVAVGPLSEVVLDDFAAPETPRVVTVSQGIFRFVSGPFARPGTHYVVKTPQVAIAVRGTRFDVRVTPGMTTIVLDEGAVDLCRAGGCEAMAPGSALDVTRYGIYPSRSPGPQQWTFRGTPGSAAHRVATALDAVAAAKSTDPLATGAFGPVMRDGLFDRGHDSHSGGGQAASASQAGSATAGTASSGSTVSGAGVQPAAGGNGAYSAMSAPAASIGAVARGTTVSRP